YQRCMLTAGIFPLTRFFKKGGYSNPQLSGGKKPDAGREMIYIGGGGGQKKDTTKFQGKGPTGGVNPAFFHKILFCFLKVEIKF
ncbi:hypothetical protein A8277_26485, partial [Salmonella enterica subsp. enterica serovar Typhimurium]|uniref:hypothetical protein n=1 Tax=Salmonella enterica TaxID=28901 RepID=UPI00084A7C11